MEPFLDVIFEDARWEAVALGPLATRAAEATLAGLGLAPEGFCACLMACDDARIAELNGMFRSNGQPTNVLSWPSEERGAEINGGVPFSPVCGSADNPESLGDIALAYETCVREAEAASKPLADHVTHLVIHGMLHLLGYDHVRDLDGDLMESIEVRTLANLGLCDPYS
jgi:probable rRNA maturation factor